MWSRRPDRSRICVLLGAFDPPTDAHVEILRSSSAAEDSEPVWGMTKVLLARGRDVMLPLSVRVELLETIADRVGFGVVFPEGGTYLEVHRILAADGFDARFVIGSDKLAQLEDPAFYPDGAAGVRSTFDEVRFVVVPRSPSDLSATQVRQLIARGAPIDHLVPPEVVRAVEAVGPGGRGYTSGT